MTVETTEAIDTGMTVRDLIHDLLNCDLDAEVAVTSATDELVAITGTDTDEEGRVLITAEA